MMDRDLLLADLVRLASEHKDYWGTVERDGTESFRLSYFVKPELNEEHCAFWNNGVRALDSIAPRVLKFIGANGITAPDAETPGASVMAWVLRVRLPTSRGRASAITNAFDAVREALLALEVDHTFADKAVQRLRRHDNLESQVLAQETAHRENERLQREKWESVCKQLRLAIERYSHRTFCDERADATPGMVEAISVACRSIDELGFRERLQQNAKRIEKFLMSGTLSSGEIEYLKGVLRLHLLLIGSIGKSSVPIAVALDEAGKLSPSACEDLRIDLWHYEQLSHFRPSEQKPVVGTSIEVTEIGSEPSAPDLESNRESQATPASEENSPPTTKTFTGGELVFYEDRVELCGVDICSGPRLLSRRKILDLLSKKDSDGKFIAYSGKRLKDALQSLGGKGEAAGAIKELRKSITKRLLDHPNVECGCKELVLSGGPGYRFSEDLSVRRADQAATTDIKDTEFDTDVFNQSDRNVRNVPDEASVARQDWILQQLVDGIELKSKHVVDQFNVSKKTALRDLTALKEAGKIEFRGSSRTGYYRLCKDQS